MSKFEDVTLLLTEDTTRTMIVGFFTGTPYTAPQLATIAQCSLTTVSRAISTLRSAGYNIRYNPMTGEYSYSYTDENYNARHR